MELRIRTLVRSLILIERNYELERKRLELELLEVDRLFGQMVAPAVGTASAFAESANAATQATGVLVAQPRLYQSRTRFVALWLQFKEQGLALYRELGAMPYDNWEAFHRSFVPDAGPPAPPADRP